MGRLVITRDTLTIVQLPLKQRSGVQLRDISEFPQMPFSSSKPPFLSVELREQRHFQSIRLCFARSGQVFRFSIADCKQRLARAGANV